MHAQRAVKAAQSIQQAPTRRDVSNDEDLLDLAMTTILDATISEEYLQSVLGKKDLLEVTYLQLKVDLNVQSLLDLTTLVPSLQCLVLDNSLVGSVRDLGVGLRCLMSLSLNSCQLEDLDGIGVLTGLEDLSACDNFITDLSPLAMHENLKSLNLSGNNLSDLSITETLTTCPNLRSLFLGRNPIVKAPNFRLVVAFLIPAIEKLDGAPVDAAARTKVSNAMVVEATVAMRLADEDLDDERRLDQDLAAGAADCVAAGVGQGSSTVSSTNNYSYRGTGTIPDTGSELTHGSTVVLAGNMAAAMRKRRGTASTSRDGGNDDVCGVGGGVGASNCDGSSSTLEVLDLALTGAASSPGGLSSPFLGEGDVTATVMGKTFPASQSTALAMLSVSEASSSADGEAASNGPRIDPSLSPAAAGQRSRHLNRREGGSVAMSTSSFDAESKDFPDGVGSYLTSISSRGSRPKSAVPSSMRGGWVGPPLGPGMDVAALESLGVSSRDQLSPRQRNGSRPQSAAATTRATPSAPFKVEVAVVKDKTASVFHEGNKAKTVNKKGAPRINEDRDDELFENEGNDACSSSRNRNTPTNSRFGTKSYVHKDLVWRGDDVNDDDEGIAVTRVARQELMSASGRRISGPGPAGVASDIHLSHHSTSSRTVASMAGVSLGFDLKGSLAAIDQWVEEMDSDDDNGNDDDDDDDDDDGDEENDVEFVDKGNTGPAGVKKPSPGSSDVDSFGRTNASSRSGSAGSSRSAVGILSREKIFSMCSGGVVGVACSDADEDGIASVLFSAASKLQQAQKQQQQQAQQEKAVTAKATKKTAGLPPVSQESVVAVKFMVGDSSGSPPRFETESETRTILGPANELTDTELIELLSRPPKSVPQLRTKSSFCLYFQGMKHARFVSVAERAFASEGDDAHDDCQAKITRRLALVESVLL